MLIKGDTILLLSQEKKFVCLDWGKKRQFEERKTVDESLVCRIFLYFI